MAVVMTLTGDLIITGEILGPTGIAYPAGSIENVDINAAAAIAASKLQRGPIIMGNQSGTAADETIIALFCKGATATLKSFTVSNLTACAGSTALTVDLKKNGTTVLSAVLTLDSSDAAFSESEGVITVPGLVNGDYLTVVIDVTQSGTDTIATGVFWQVEFDADRS